MVFPRWIISVGIGIIVTAGSFWILWLVFDNPYIHGLWQTIDWFIFAAAFLCAVSTQAVRAWRLALMLNRPVSLALIGLIARHQFWANLLPLRAGELTLPLFLRTEYQISFARGLKTLLVLRAYDLGTLLAIGGLTGGWALTRENASNVFGLVLYGVGGLATIMLIGLPMALRMVGSGGLKRLLLSGKLLDGLESFAKLQSQQHFLILMSSGSVWLTVIITYGLAFTAANVHLTSLQVIVASAAGAFAFALPINGIAGLGPFEAAISTALIHFKITEPMAICAALAAHLAVFTATAAQAMISHVIQRYGLGQASEAP